MRRRGLPSWNGVFQTSEILARLDRLIVEVARWGPAGPVALGFVVALVEAVILPVRLWAKGAWVALVVLCGIGAVAVLRWEQRTAYGAAADRTTAETTALRGLWSQLDSLSHTLSSSTDDKPVADFDTVDDGLAALSTKIAAINEQVASLRAGMVGRSVDPETTVKLADYLRQYGSYRAVVTCAPNDVEAYSYANQLVGILKAAGWDANGPETTVNVLEGPAMGVSVFVRDPTAPDAAKLLIDAFNQFNIPHQPGVAADATIPDSATVELFVAKKP